MSKTRRNYLFRLWGRISILLLCVFSLIFFPEWFEIMGKGRFLQKFSPLHILWLIWMGDMIQQIIPVKNKIALGSQKLFANRFRPIREKINHQALRQYVVNTTKSAYKVLLLWGLLVAVLGILYFTDLLPKTGLFIISVVFYVCDLICVLIWCPFRLIMKNKCCTTCRIFNWDHLMMFSPLIYLDGFFSVSLVVMAFLAWLVWEVCVLLYPERFWEMTNVALKCSECTDKLCTQYCQKLRKDRVS